MSGRAWAWVDHLRDGGTTTWSVWSGPAGPATPVGDSRGPLLAGAQQLELLRRLNVVARHGSPVPPALATRVLTASAPGRGRPDLELVGAVEPSRFGPRPVDPGALPQEELIRVATGLIAEDLVDRAAELPEPRVDRSGRFVDAPVAQRRPRRWRAAYVLAGDPWLVDPARHHLVSRGRPAGGRGAVAVVVGTDLATMLADAWTARCFGDGAPPWRDFLAAQVRRGSLAPRADVARTAGRWATRLGPERVAVVLDPGALPSRVGLRRPLPTRPRLAAHAVELARLTGPALGLLATPPRVSQLLVAVLLPRLAGVPGDPIVVPAGRVRWVHRQAVRQREAVGAGGYAVHGDLDLLLPRGSAGVSEPSDQAVLDLAITLLLEGLLEGTTGIGDRAGTERRSR